MTKKKTDEALKVRKCKIMFFVYILGQGGAERVILNILNHINLDKYEVYLTLGQRENNDYLPFLKRQDQIKLNYLDVPLGNNELAQDKLAALIDQTKVDILFTEAYFTNTLAYHASKKARHRVKLIFREAIHRTQTEKRTLKNFLKVFLRYNYKAEKIVAISNGVKDDLVKSYGVKNNKITRIYNPVNIQEVRENANVKIDDETFNKIHEKKIINVARLTRGKNQKNLIDAFGILSKKRNDIALVILGRGDLEQSLKEYCKQKGLQKVYFLGFKKNPHYYIKNADVFALSSNLEGFGNVLTETMAIGTPIVSTDCMSGPKEILENGKNGLLVSVGNSEQLASAIDRVLDDEQLRKELIKNAKERVKDFEVAKIVREYENVIDEVYKNVRHHERYEQVTEKWQYYKNMIQQNRRFILRHGKKAFVEKIYRERMNTEVDLSHPICFNEKLNARKLSKNKLLSLCADKAKVREYVKEKIGEKYLIPQYFCKKKITVEDLERLPKEFILKSSNGSGTNMIVTQKEAEDLQDICDAMNYFTKIKYGYIWGEFYYNKVPIRIVAEKLLKDEQGNIPNDLKIHCFNNGKEKHKIIEYHYHAGGGGSI